MNNSRMLLLIVLAVAILLAGELFVVHFLSSPASACCGSDEPYTPVMDAYGRDISDKALSLPPVPWSYGTSASARSTAQVSLDLFEPYVAYPDGGNAVRVVDIDGDGHNEVIVARESGKVDIWEYATEQLTLTQEITVMASRIEGMAIGDFDDNSELDIVISDYDHSVVEVAYQDGGVFTRTASYPVGTNAYAIDAGDLNNDHLSDIAAKGWDSRQLHVLFQTPEGTLNTFAYSAPQAGWDELEIGDVSGDDLLDIVFMSGQMYANPNLSVYLQGSSEGTLLMPPSTYDLGDINADAIAILDYNRDGRNDVAMTYGGNDARVAIWEQQSDGTLTNAITYQAYDAPEAATAMDLNGDGADDLVLLHGGWLAASVWYQQPNGGFAGYDLHSLPYVSHYSHQALALGDVNGDRCPDLVVSQPQLLVLYHRCMVADKHVTPDPVLVGETFTYTIEVTNYAPVTVTDVMVTDTLPVGVDFVDGDVLCDLALPDLLVCGPYSPGPGAQIQVLMNVTATQAAAGWVLNQATVSRPTQTGVLVREAQVSHFVIVGRTYLPLIMR